MTRIDAPDRPAPTWWQFGLANLLIVVALSLGGWYLLADPTTSPLDVYPLPFNAALFWALMFVVWAGFNLELAGFARLPQPVRGLAVATASIGFGVLVTWVLADGFGAVNPDFAGSRADGLGYFTGALFVLFGFSTYVMSVLNWGHWPWSDLGLRQPLLGWCEIGFLMLPTILLYAVLGLPAVSASATAPLLDVNTLLGWYYSVVVAIVLTGLTWDNYPWRLSGSRGVVAGVSVLGNLLLGTALYAGLLGASKLLLGHEVVTALGDAVTQFPAQLGVCWVAWMILWANAFGNRPSGLGDAANVVARTAITFALAVATFVGYYYVVAETVLHEPPVAGPVSGNALGFLDWFALVTLLYVVGFGSWGLRAPVDEPAGDPNAVSDVNG